ncbi:MAG TPA: hypoxanthine phosphoribosyltransferase [Syntrophomonadaceae bacterium]|nr:hypoxanthine phosphoribosyltransferase [Syntrophomonadaceae bacterium]
MNQNLADILYSQIEIMDKVEELGKQIEGDYKGKDLLVIGILKGAFVFMADLVRKIDLPMGIDFMAVSSYGSAAISSGEVKIVKDLDHSIKDKHILIVEDIVDTGLTLKYIKQILSKREPKSIKICCLLDKPSRRIADVYPEYVGFSIPDEFVVGYGLDFDEKYRNIPEVCILKPAAYEK